MLQRLRGEPLSSRESGGFTSPPAAREASGIAADRLGCRPRSEAPMIATRAQAIVAALVASLVIAGVARAQSPGVYVPSTHDPGCRGLICADPIDPSHPPPPPPPCEGLICGLTPYGMERPYNRRRGRSGRTGARGGTGPPRHGRPCRSRPRRSVARQRCTRPRLRRQGTAAPAEPGADAAK